MRGVYTSGVLDAFIKHGLNFKYVIAVSAGASNGASYISNQYQRNRSVNLNYIRDSRFLSLRNLFKEKSLFGMDFLFDILPNKLEPFDFDSFFNSMMTYKIVATDCHTGKAVYFDKKDMNRLDLMQVLRASTSIPYGSPMVSFRGYTLLDGGIADSIPIFKSISDGNLRNVIVLTRDRHYRKQSIAFGKLIALRYHRYPELVRSLKNRSRIYNETLDAIEKMEQSGDVFVIRPRNPVQVGRLEKDRDRLEMLYEEGVKDVDDCVAKLRQWLRSK